MREKIIFLDIDGTLTAPGSNVPPASALRAIEKARKNGHHVFLCSGRNYAMLKPLLSYGFDGYVASCGGYIDCGGTVIFDCPMTKEQETLVFDVFRRYGVYYTVECVNASYTDEGFKIYLKEHAGEGGNSELLRWQVQIEQSLNIRPMEEYRGEPVYKMVIMSPEAEKLAGLAAELSEDFTICVQNRNLHGFVNGELVNRKFDKGKAVERVCRYLEIPIEDSIAFGDSMNDLEMLEKAGLSVCMANGSEELKKIADEICPAVDDDGLWKAFEKYHLI